jgi:hypothetical protein
MINGKKLLIGIDPGVHCGVAVSVDRKLQHCETISWWKCIDMISITYHQNEVDELIIEDSSLNNYTYNRGNVGNVAMRQSRNAGMNQGYSKLMVERFKSLGYNVKQIRPTQDRHKWSKEYFESISGWKERTSEHARDAARFVL